VLKFSVFRPQKLRLRFRKCCESQPRAASPHICRCSALRCLINQVPKHPGDKNPFRTTYYLHHFPEPQPHCQGRISTSRAWALCRSCAKPLRVPGPGKEVLKHPAKLPRSPQLPSSGKPPATASPQPRGYSEITARSFIENRRWSGCSFRYICSRI